MKQLFKWFKRLWTKKNKITGNVVETIDILVSVKKIITDRNLILRIEACIDRWKDLFSFVKRYYE